MKQEKDNKRLNHKQEWELNKWIESLGEDYVKNREMNLNLLAETATKELRFKIIADNIMTAIECVF